MIRQLTTETSADESRWIALVERTTEVGGKVLERWQSWEFGCHVCDVLDVDLTEEQARDELASHRCAKGTTPLAFSTPEGGDDDQTTDPGVPANDHSGRDADSPPGRSARAATAGCLAVGHDWRTVELTARFWRSGDRTICGDRQRCARCNAQRIVEPTASR